MQEQRGRRSPPASVGLRERLRLRLLCCFIRSRTAAEPLAEPLPAPTADVMQAESSAFDTRRAAIRSLSGSCVCSGWRTMANSQLAGRELSSSEQLADEHELEDEEEHEDDDEDEEEHDDASLLASLLTLLLLRALR